MPFKKTLISRSVVPFLFVALVGCLVQPGENNNADSNDTRPLEQLVQIAIAEYARELAELSDEMADDLSQNKDIDERQLKNLLTERARRARAKAWKNVDSHWAAQLSQWKPTIAQRLLRQQAKGYRSTERALRNTKSNN